MNGEQAGNKQLFTAQSSRLYKRLESITSFCVHFLASFTSRKDIRSVSTLLPEELTCSHTEPYVILRMILWMIQRGPMTI